jgi:hypothetical protein
MKVFHLELFETFTLGCMSIPVNAPVKFIPKSRLEETNLEGMLSLCRLSFY